MIGEKIDIVVLANNPTNERFYDMGDIYNMLARTSVGMSWGMHKPGRFGNTVLFFSVQGFILKGSVYLTVENDDFNIIFTNRAGIIQDELKGIGIENLQDVIDSRVEKNVSDKKYAEMVKKSMARL